MEFFNCILVLGLKSSNHCRTTRLLAMTTLEKLVRLFRMVSLTEGAANSIAMEVDPSCRKELTHVGIKGRTGLETCSIFPRRIGFPCKLGSSISRRIEGVWETRGSHLQCACSLNDIAKRWRFGLSSKAILRKRIGHDEFLRCSGGGIRVRYQLSRGFPF